MKKVSLKHTDFVFVFGSNDAGRHGKGAAVDAVESYGAQEGVGSGFVGNSYAIITKKRLATKELVTSPIEEIKEQVDQFVCWAKENPDKKCMVSKIGCGLAGYSEQTIAALFPEDIPSNIMLPGAWVKEAARKKGYDLVRLLVWGSRVPKEATAEQIETIKRTIKEKLEIKLQDIKEKARKEGLKVMITGVSGGAGGVDRWALDYLESQGCNIFEINADWNSGAKKRSGFVRNSALVWATTQGVGFWDGKSNGSVDTAKKLNREGIEYDWCDWATGKELEKPFGGSEIQKEKKGSFKR